MKTLFIAFFLGVCCFLFACDYQVGRNQVEKGTVNLDFGEQFEFVTEVGPAEIYKNLGASYLERGELDKALVEFKKALQANPRFVEAHYLLADVYSLKGERSLSLKSLDQAMELEGSYIIDTRIIGETHIIPESTVIESTESIPHIFPPNFFQGPIEHKNLDSIDRP